MFCVCLFFNFRYYEEVGKSEVTVVDTYWQTETGGKICLFAAAAAAAASNVIISTSTIDLFFADIRFSSPSHIKGIL